MFQARLLFLGGLLLLVGSSCATKMARVHEEDFLNLNPSKKGRYRLVTTENRVYEFSRFAVTDSTLVIEDTHWPGSFAPPDAFALRTPIVVRWHEVRTLERVETNIVKNMFAMSVGTAFGLAAFGGLLLIVQLATAD